MFFYLAYKHFRASGKSISPFEAWKRPMMRPDSGVQVSIGMAGAGVDEPLEHFVKDFNSYIGDYNKSSRTQNQWQAVGYLVAAVAALLSMALSLGIQSII
jgi:hypothetical protein